MRPVPMVVKASSPEAEKLTAADGLVRRPLFGLQMIDAGQLETVVDAVLARPTADSATLPILVTPNVDILVLLDRAPNSVEADTFRRAQFVLPDGMPIVKVSRLLGQPLQSRLTGSGLFDLLWPRLAAERRRVTVVCAHGEIGRLLVESHPRVSIVVPPFFDVDDPGELGEVVDQVLERIDPGDTEYVLFGLGHPKDSVLAREVCRRWSGGEGRRPPLCLGLGASFEMHTGLKRRAPQLVQRLGAEWLYRFSQEPRRLFARYFVRDIAFIGLVKREYRAIRGGAGQAGDR